jgi:triacylglycerol lipase
MPECGATMGTLTAMRYDVFPKERQRISDGVAFDIEKARVLAWAAQLAYEVDKPDKVTKIFTQWEWKSLGTFSGSLLSHLPMGGTKGFAASVDSNMVIAFAGTEPNNPLDWIKDFSIIPTHEGVTTGFEAGWESVQQQIAGAVRGTLGKVFFAGHSLGGALAVVAAKQLTKDLGIDRVAGVYTIGMPRPGNVAYADDYNQLLGDRTFRLVHGEDVVPRVPPGSAGYRHIGHVLFCEHGGTFAGTPAPTVEGQPGAEDLNSLDILELFSSGHPEETETDKLDFPSPLAWVSESIRALPRAARDHLADRYLEALSALTLK